MSDDGSDEVTGRKYVHSIRTFNLFRRRERLLIGNSALFTLADVAMHHRPAHHRQWSLSFVGKVKSTHLDLEEQFLLPPTQFYDELLLFGCEI